MPARRCESSHHAWPPTDGEVVMYACFDASRDMHPSKAENPAATQAQARMALVKGQVVHRCFDGTLPGKWKPDLRVQVSTAQKQHPLAGLSPNWHDAVVRQGDVTVQTRDGQHSDSSPRGSHTVVAHRSGQPAHLEGAEERKIGRFTDNKAGTSRQNRSTAVRGRWPVEQHERRPPVPTGTPRGRPRRAHSCKL